MSHNVTMKGIKITDLDLLQSALKALNVESKGVSFDKNAQTFRTYAGQPNKCDHRITLPGVHDVGLLKQPDGSYSPVYDPYQMSDVLVSKGLSQDMRNRNQGYHISGLMQEYALQQAEFLAASQGLLATRIPAKDGTVCLEVEYN